MRYAISLVMLAALAVSIEPALAQQTPAPPPAGAAQPAPTPAEVDAQIAKLQELMTQMNQQMAEIQKTTDPAKRQQLMQEHWTTMQSAMTLMQGAGGNHMGMGHMMWGDYRNLTPEQLKQRQYMMDQMMPMQQMMMGHMMQYQGMMQRPGMMQAPPGTPPATPPAK